MSGVRPVYALPSVVQKGRLHGFPVIEESVRKGILEGRKRSRCPAGVGPLAGDERLVWLDARTVAVIKKTPSPLSPRNRRVWLVVDVVVVGGRPSRKAAA